MRIILMFLAIALNGCDGLDAQDIPLGPDTGFRGGNLVQVSSAGSITWNGMILTDPELKAFVRQDATLPPDAGRLWVEFDPNAPSERVRFVKTEVIKSGLCEQKRCLEGKWGAKRPVIN